MTSIVDAHVHLWDTERLEYPWLSEFEPLRRPFRPKDLAAARPPIDGYVHVQADARPDLAVAEVDLVTELAARVDPPLLAVVAFAPLEMGAAVAELLAELNTRPIVRGVRRSTQNDPDGLLSSRQFVAGMQQVLGAGWSVDLCVRAKQLPEVVRAIDDLDAPDGPIILDHAGKPDIRSGEFATWQHDLAHIAASANTYCKLSGLITEADWQTWRPAQLRPYIDTVLETFGPARVMFGSDWPVLTLASNYLEWFAIVDAALAHVSATERDDVLGETARRAYRIGPATTTPAATDSSASLEAMNTQQQMGQP